MRRAARGPGGCVSAVRAWALVLVAAGVAAAARAAESPGAAPQGADARPKVALVLSGGGARGGAHLGVLKVLEEMRVPVDMIVGTSAGAIVGAAYATGLPLTAIEHEMRGLNTAQLVRDVPRVHLAPQRKADDAINYVGPEMGWGPAGLELPKGAVAGVAVEAVLRRLTARQQNVNFDRLPIPFRAVATDLASSDMVVLDHGSLAQAVRASMAVPAVFNPVELDGRLLVDGGVKRNLPVDVARAMGADVVIAVNIGTPLLRRDQITSLLSASEQLLRILTEGNVAQSIRELRERDVLLTPDLADLGSSDFDRLGEAAQAGERAARAAAGRLSALQLAGSAYVALLASRTAADPPAGRRIDEVRVVGTRRVDPETVSRSMRTRAGQAFDAQLIDQDLQRLYGRGDFEAVSYTLSDEPGVGRVLTANVTEKSWGPHYLRFGLGLSSDFEGNSFFDLLATHRATWLNRWGGEWRNDLQIGRTDRLRSEWLQPLSVGQQWFAAAHLQTQRQPLDIYDDDGERVARYRLGEHHVGADLGLQLGTSGELRLGLQRGSVRLHDDTSFVPPALLNADGPTGALVAQLRLDTLDNLRFPRAGYALDARWTASRTALGGRSNYRKLAASLRTATARGPHSLQLALQGVRVQAGDGQIPPHEASFLGGFQRLSGYKTGELNGMNLVLGRAVYNYRLAAAGFLDGAYAGFSLEAGRVGDSFRETSRGTMRFGSSLYVALDTPLGPVYLAYGRAQAGRQALYFFLGQPW